MDKEKMIELMTATVKESAEEIVSAIKEYRRTKAELDSVIEKATEIQERILAENVYNVSPEIAEQLDEAGKAHGRRFTTHRITRPFDSYMMTDSDHMDYLNKCYVEYCKAGIEDDRGCEYIPEAREKEAHRNAENHLLDVFQIIAVTISPEDFQMMRTHWKYRERLIQLALDMERLEGVECTASL